MTGFVESAIAREVASAKLAPDVMNGDDQPTREQVFAVPANRFGPPEVEGVRISPLGRPRHDDDVRREPRSLAT